MRVAERMKPMPRLRQSALQAIELPTRPTRRSGSVLAALQLRKTTRELSPRKLPPEMISDLLWAAFGVNRSRGPFGMPGRTAASASNSQEIDVYVAMQEGVFLYEPLQHKLIPIREGDIRPLAISAGQRKIGDKAPLRLIYVADVDRLANTAGFPEPGLRDPEVQRSYYYVDTGLIAANVYLFAAEVGLGAWFHNCDRAALTAKLGLTRDQRVLFAQTVGYPAEKRSRERTPLLRAVRSRGE
jgi:nitroreductase